MKSNLFTVKCLTVMIFSLFQFSFATAQEMQWELALEKNGIKVFTRDVENSQLKAFKGQMTLQGVDISTVENYLKNFANLPQWLDRCNEAKVLKQHNPENAVVYVSLGMPWPVKDRDVIGLSQMEINQEGTRLTSHIKDIHTNEYHYTVNGRIRAEKLDSKMIFTVEKNGELLVVIEGHAEPGGKIPSWLANLLVTESPFKSLKNIRKELTKLNSSAVTLTQLEHNL